MESRDNSKDNRSVEEDGRVSQPSKSLEGQILGKKKASKKGKEE